MLKSNERWVTFYELHLSSHPDNRIPVSCEEVAEALARITGTQEGRYLFRNDAAGVMLTHHKYNADKNADTFLCRLADMDVSDPAFSHLQTGNLRLEPKQDQEGRAYSCHVIIERNELAPGSGRYRVLLEDVPGLGRTRLTPFFKSRIRHIYRDHEFAFEGRQLKWWPVFELLGTPSQKLQADLARGRISEVEFVRLGDETGEAVDEIPNSQLLRQSLKVRLSGVQTTPRRLMDLFRSLRSYANQHGYDHYLIRYKRTDGNKQSTLEVPAHREDALDVLTTRVERIAVANPLPDCSDQIVDELADQMLQLI